MYKEFNNTKEPEELSKKEKQAILIKILAAFTAGMILCFAGFVLFDTPQEIFGTIFAVLGLTGLYGSYVMKNLKKGIVLAVIFGLFALFICAQKPQSVAPGYNYEAPDYSAGKKY